LRTFPRQPAAGRRTAPVLIVVQALQHLLLLVRELRGHDLVGALQRGFGPLERSGRRRRRALEETHRFC